MALTNVDGFVARMRTLMDQALTLATEPKQKERIETIRKEFDAWMARAEPYLDFCQRIE